MCVCVCVCVCVCFCVWSVLKEMLLPLQSKYIQMSMRYPLISYNVMLLACVG